MPHKQSLYVFDHCPKCGSDNGSVYLRQWKKPEGVFLKAEDVRGISINQRRAFMKLPPLNDQELAELNELNQETVSNMRVIAAGHFAIVALIPRLFNDYPDMFPPAVVYHMFRINVEFMESVIDDTPKKIDLGRWLEIARWFNEYGSYRAASRKTRFQSWDGVWHQVSPKYIKQKLPEIIKFQKDYEMAKHNMAIFLINLNTVLVNDPELNKLYEETFERSKQEQTTRPHTEAKPNNHQYYIIRHKLEKGRKECGPFKEGQIPGLARLLSLA